MIVAWTHWLLFSIYLANFLEFQKRYHLSIFFAPSGHEYIFYGHLHFSEDVDEKWWGMMFFISKEISPSQVVLQMNISLFIFFGFFYLWCASRTNGDFCTPKLSMLRIVRFYGEFSATFLGKTYRKLPEMLDNCTRTF